MANTEIRLKHSTVSGNTPSFLANGEIAINGADGKIFYRTPSGTIQSIQGFSGPTGLNGEIQFNDSGNLGASSNLTFNKVTGLLNVESIKTNSYYDIKDTVRQYSNTLITNFTTQTVLTTYSTNSFCSGKFVIQANTGTNRQATELLVVHDNITAYAVEYAIIRTNSNLFNVEVDILDDNVRVLVSSASSDLTTYKMSASLISV